MASATPRGGAVGTFRVALQSVSLKRRDGGVEDDFKTWALCAVVSGATRRSLPRVWYADGADAPLAKTSVTNGFDAAYNYVRASKPVPLEDGALTDLVEALLTVNVFKGGARDAAKDVWIGGFAVELSKLVGGGKVRSRDR